MSTRDIIKELTTPPSEDLVNRLIKNRDDYKGVYKYDTVEKLKMRISRVKVHLKKHKGDRYYQRFKNEALALHGKLIVKNYLPKSGIFGMMKALEFKIAEIDIKEDTEDMIKLDARYIQVGINALRCMDRYKNDARDASD
jgi:hypothetical protein